MAPHVQLCYCPCRSCTVTLLCHIMEGHAYCVDKVFKPHFQVNLVFGQHKDTGTHKDKSIAISINKASCTCMMVFGFVLQKSAEAEGKIPITLKTQVLVLLRYNRADFVLCGEASKWS